MSSARGYNFFDVFAACALISSLLAVGFSFLQGVTEQQRLHLAGETFLAAVTAARFQAVSKNLATQILIHTNKQQFAVTVKDEPAPLWQQLPRGVAFSKTPTRPPTFYSRGFASPAGTFALVNPAGEIRVIVSVSGRVRWERVQ